jgi:hypothetical protein
MILTMLMMLLCTMVYGLNAGDWNGLVTEAFTGMSCPFDLRIQEPVAYCVTHSGIPQSGCSTIYGFAYRLEVQETIIPDCFRVLWFWKQ